MSFLSIEGKHEVPIYRREKHGDGNLKMNKKLNGKKNYEGKTETGN